MWFINTERQMLTSIQQKLVKDELIFVLKTDGNSTIDFLKVSSALVLLPVNADFKSFGQCDTGVQPVWEFSGRR